MMMSEQDKIKFQPYQVAPDMSIDNMIKEQEGSNFDATEATIDTMRRDVKQREKIRKKNHDIAEAQESERKQQHQKNKIDYSQLFRKTDTLISGKDLERMARQKSLTKDLLKKQEALVTGSQIEKPSQDGK